MSSRTLSSFFVSLQGKHSFLPPFYKSRKYAECPTTNNTNNSTDTEKQMYIVHNKVSTVWRPHPEWKKKGPKNGKSEHFVRMTECGCGVTQISIVVCDMEFFSHSISSAPYKKRESSKIQKSKMIS